MKKLFPLIVGIDGYQSVRPLYGCINDAHRMKTYIESPFIQSKVTPTPMRFLTEEKATKAGIVAAFEAVAKEIGAEDIFFFYFSGHGVREKTTIPLFTQAEADGAIETLVCFDSKVAAGAGYKDNTFLADKELRYLLAQIAAKKARIFTVFDNCHSGDNTRAIVNELNFQDKAGETIEARIVDLSAVPERAWEGFIFANKIDKSKLDGSVPLVEIIPLAPHIHISACRDVEKAYEGPQDDGKRGGYFTKAFTQIMESTQGNISLYHLQTRLSNLLRRLDNKSQNPQIDVYSGNPMDIHRTFLFSDIGNVGEVFGYLDQTPEGAFHISLGALNGIKKDTKISISAQKDSSKTWTANVTKLTPGYAVVAIAGGFAYNKADTYKVTAKVENFAKVNVLLDTDLDKGVAKKSLESHPYYQKYFQFVSVEDEADYVLRACSENGTDFYKMTLHCDNRPIVQPVAGFNPLKLQFVIDDLKQISEWRFLKDFKHEEKVAEAILDGIKVRLYQMDLSEPKKPNSQRVERQLDIDKMTTTVHTTEVDEDGALFSWIRFEIENTTNVEVYISFIMLSSLFGITTNVLKLEAGIDADRMLLRPKEIAKTRSFKAQPGFFKFAIDDYIIKDKWVGQNLNFKLIASTNPFMTSNLSKEDILPPYTSKERIASKGVTFSDEEEDVAADFWFTKDIELFFPNPNYK